LTPLWLLYARLPGAALQGNKGGLIFYRIDA
jgi:hypothetical protein